MEGREMQVRDLVGRAHGILRQAHLLTSREMLDLLSGLRLGIELDLVKNADVKLINELMLLTQPGHLQRIMKQTINPEERDTVRARIVRERLAKLTIEQDLMKDSI
jgi:protein arginine kinase